MQHGAALMIRTRELTKFVHNTARRACDVAQAMWYYDVVSKDSCLYMHRKWRRATGRTVSDGGRPALGAGDVRMRALSAASH